jgi:hypothetical protein
METKFNNFTRDLEFSFDTKDDDFINKFYFRVFPNLDKIENVILMELQKRGIDKILHFKNGKQVLIDEKKRRRNYGDILIEEYSNFETKKWGWISREKHTDYIVYIIMDIQKIYLLPFLLLQKAWIKNYKQWLSNYGRKNAKNYNANNEFIYTTSNIAIPTTVLLTAIKNEFEQELNEAPTKY